MLFLRLSAVGLLLATALSAQSLQLAQTIPLPRADGRIDHLSLDAAGGRLFVASLGHNTVEIVDLKAGRVARSLPGFSEPQGVYYLAELNRLYVANGGTGAMDVLDGSSFARLASIKCGDDADNVRYDATAKQIYVGYGSGALGIIDPAKNTLLGSIPLGSHPESFQLEPDGSRIFVNVPGSHTIAVVDRTARKVVTNWSLGLVAANFPLALDAAHHRAFVACRVPARLLVFDTESGRELAKLDLHGDCDDVFFDAQRRQIYASCGDGFIDVFTQTDPDHYSRKESLPTPPRARTSLFDGEHLYLAAPRAGGEEARILIYHFPP